MQRGVVVGSSSSLAPLAGPSRSLHTTSTVSVRANRYPQPRSVTRAVLNNPIVKPQNAKVFNVRDYLPTSPVSPPLNNRKAAPSRYAAKQWLMGEGARYKAPSGKGPHWIGDTPFPLNPSFRPPPPLTDSVKRRIYMAYKTRIQSIDASETPETRWSKLPSANPTEPPAHTALIRKIAQETSVAMDRVRAVIRLKAIEERMRIAGIPCQDRFAEGMANELGVDPADARLGTAESAEEAVGGSKQSGSVEFVNAEEGEKPIHASLLQRTRTRRQLPPQALNAREQRVQRDGKRDLVFADMAETTRGRSWERTNRNKTSRSAHAARAAELSLLDRLGRLPQRAFTGAEAEALAEARKETKPAL